MSLKNPVTPPGIDPGTGVPELIHRKVKGKGSSAHAMNTYRAVDAYLQLLLTSEPNRMSGQLHAHAVLIPGKLPQAPVV
jgi:hypothetical protein